MKPSIAFFFLLMVRKAYVLHMMSPLSHRSYYTKVCSGKRENCHFWSWVEGRSFFSRSFSANNNLYKPSEETWERKNLWRENQKEKSPLKVDKFQNLCKKARKTKTIVAKKAKVPVQKFRTSVIFLKFLLFFNNFCCFFVALVVFSNPW